jgi:hypothetical protein
MNSELDVEKLKEILEELSKERPIFESEDDFKFSLAWKIKEEYEDENKDKNIDIRLEKNFIIENENGEEENYRIDIFIRKWKIGIELKYYTAECDYESDDERIKLKNQFAYDHKCYDAWKDIQRLETFIKKRFIKKGFAIWLTNVSLLTKPCEDIKNDESGYYKFRIFNGRKNDPVMEWSGDLSEGTTKGRKESIELDEEYEVHWNVYSDVSKNKKCKKNGIFKYALIEVRIKGF